MATSKVLLEGMPGDDHSGAAVLLEPSHRMQPRFEAAVVGLDVVLAYRSVRCQAAGSNSSSTAGYTGAWSVITSTGATCIVPMARWKNRRAAAASRRGDTNTSMTCPNWSIAR